MPQDLVVISALPMEIHLKQLANSKRVGPSVEMLETRVICPSTVMASQNGVPQMFTKLMVKHVIPKRDIDPIAFAVDATLPMNGVECFGAPLEQLLAPGVLVII